MVGLFSSWYVKAACLKTGVPFACLHYHPGMIPSRERPPAGFPAWRWLNPLSWSLFGLIFNLGFRGPGRKFWESKGVPGPGRVLTDIMMSERLNLVATSRALFQAPSDWGDRDRLVGHFEVPLDDAASWEPSAALREFLERGDKPILACFGTMALLAPERVRDLVVSAARKAGVRVILQTRSGEGGAEGEVFHLGWAPHHRLLPHCSAMVLHGGAGTVHAALRGGVPAMVLPFIMEQRLWGNLLARAGAAVKPLSFWKATPDRLAALMVEATGSQALRQRAAELAQVVAGEDGTGTAVSLLEAMASG
jgi:UDP:flavonoid glycosyltransferase YjiC (YdhE family)